MSLSAAGLRVSRRVPSAQEDFLRENLGRPGAFLERVVLDVTGLAAEAHNPRVPVEFLQVQLIVLSSVVGKMAPTGFS